MLAVSPSEPCRDSKVDYSYWSQTSISLVEVANCNVLRCEIVVDQAGCVDGLDLVDKLDANVQGNRNRALTYLQQLIKRLSMR
jgi:hypothetical protein